MKAKLTKNNISNGKNLGSVKETIEEMKLVCFKKGKFTEPIVVRLYMGRSASASVVYCSLWVHDLQKGVFYISGHGSAGGYGYHKESAAMQEALDSAGIELYGSAYVSGTEKTYRGEPVDYKKKARINGRGDSSMREAILAIGEALGYTRKQMTIV
jgi:hypothetical protein